MVPLELMTGVPQHNSYVYLIKWGLEHLPPEKGTLRKEVPRQWGWGALQFEINCLMVTFFFIVSGFLP